VNTVSEFRKALKKAGDSKTILFLVKDGRSSRFIVVRLD